MYSPCSIFPGAERKASHLRCDTDAALVQQRNGVLVALKFLTEQVILGDFNIVKVDDAGTAGFDAKLLLGKYLGR